MKLQKIESGGVWVKASDELPKVEGMPIIISYGSHRHPFVTVFYKKRFIASDVNDFGEKHYEDIEWLKPIKDVYVLTEDEFRQQGNEENTGALIKRFGEAIVQRDKLKQELEQERFHHSNTRLSWNATLEKMGKLINFKNKNGMKTGIELIAEERLEQIEKHGRTIEKDVELNSNEQLSMCAEMLLAAEHEEGIDSNSFPDGWDKEICRYMLSKPYKERLIIAGALIAAEIDRLQTLI